MSFLTPALLVALPLAAIPIIIHLLNQRRYQTVNWGAMQFLLTANQTSRGVAKIRSWLILAARTLAILGFIIAVSRPLAGGWVGALSDSSADTTLVLIDRSPSMAQGNASGTTSKLDAGLSKLSSSLGMAKSTRWVLVDGANADPQEIESSDDLRKAAATNFSSASSNLPVMLEAAYSYIQENNCGQTNVWILSDLRANDWNAESGEWEAIRKSFGELPQEVKFHLLAYPELSQENVSVRVTDVKQAHGDQGSGINVTVKLIGGGEGKNSVPVRFEIGGAVSELAAEWEGSQFELKDHFIPLDGEATSGWGRVSIPADVNSADNDFYFVFAEDSAKKTAIVCDEPEDVVVIKRAAAASMESDSLNPVDVLAPNQTDTIEWDGLSLLIWQAPLPTGETAAKVESFVADGGRTLFMPPKTPDSGKLLGVSWGMWRENKDPLPVSHWRGDGDALANVKSGGALPVGELRIKRFCGLEGEGVKLASLSDNYPLLLRLSSARGGIYFLTTTARGEDSTLSADGIVLYTLVQRLLTDGAGARSQRDNVVAGATAADDALEWKQVAGPEEAVTSDYSNVEGIYSTGERLTAVNRSDGEDDVALVSDASVDRLFDGLKFDWFRDDVSSLESLTKEVWKLFLFAMMVAIFVEAFLCMPKRPTNLEMPR